MMDVRQRIEHDPRFEALLKGNVFFEYVGKVTRALIESNAGHVVLVRFKHRPGERAERKFQRSKGTGIKKPGERVPDSQIQGQGKGPIFELWNEGAKIKERHFPQVNHTLAST